MSKLALSGLALGAAMAVGTAQAEPLTLSAGQMDQVTAAGFGVVDFDAFLDKIVNVDKNVFINKEVHKFQDVFVQGFFGEAEAFANCFDAAAFGCEAITESFTDVINAEGEWEVTSVSTSEAATSGFSIFVDNGTTE
jgi:hypothetical protein